MGDRTPSSLNLRIIQKYDPKAQRIIFTGRHVVLYKFEESSWLRVGIEGTLFIYEGDTRLNLTILNRQNMDNFSTPLEQLRDLHTERDFLMFSDVTGTVYGLWFFLGEEMVQFQALVERLRNGKVRDFDEQTSILDHLIDARSRRARFSGASAADDIFNGLSVSGSPCDSPDAFKKALLTLIREDSALVERLYNEYHGFLESRHK